MKKKDIISLIVFTIGLITLVVGVVFLIIRFTSGPNTQDGDYLVSAKEWTLKSDTNCEKNEGEEANCIEEPSVIWKFTEIGKGTLTTNGHTNDYDFIWAIEDGKLKIETSWLYDLEDEYDYKLDQRNGTLVLTSGEEEIEFVASFEN